ncbi:MAG: DUF922 domain-containing protein [Salinimicrobium sp.]
MKNILLLLLFSTGVLAQQPGEKISWGERPLTWLDFQSIPAPQNRFHASSNTGISYSWSARHVGEEIQFAYTVEASFDPQKSWVSEKAESLLAHEQLHFDISELHARLLRKKLKEFKPQGQKDLKRALRGVYEKTEAARRQMQEQYDLVTRHGSRAEAQKSWEQKIASALRELEKFKAKD